MKVWFYITLALCIIFAYTSFTLYILSYKNILKKRKNLIIIFAVLFIITFIIWNIFRNKISV